MPKLNNGFWQKIAGGAFLLLLSVTWVWVDTRASEEDVKSNTDEIKEVRKETNKRLRGVETNTIKMCQVLDRLDSATGGPGIDCKDPE